LSFCTGSCRCRSPEYGNDELVGPKVQWLVGIAEHIPPLRKAQVGGDDYAGSFIQLAEQMEQQCPASLAKRQVAFNWEVGFSLVIGSL